MINDKKLKDLIFSILIILFVVLSLNIIVFFSYNKIAEIDHSIFIKFNFYTNIINLFNIFKKINSNS